VARVCNVENSNFKGLRKDLGLMVAYVKQIQAVDKKGVAPLVSVSSAQRAPLLAASDESSDLPHDTTALDREQLLARATATQEGFYVVPSSLDEQDAQH
jgi:Asp-tRNA(Asn)/Glu-tRNA(Gln) amidotransferase C subunit